MYLLVHPLLTYLSTGFLFYHRQYGNIVILMLSLTQATMGQLINQTFTYRWTASLSQANYVKYLLVVG